MKAKMKYLGTYTYFLNDQQEYDHEDVDILVNVEDNTDYYPMGSFCNPEGSGDTMFNGYMSETNSSVIGLKMSSCNDDFRLWRLW